MIFSSHVFLFLFLPAVILGYFALGRLNRPWLPRLFLVLASLYFYAYFNWSYLLLIVASILINYGCGAGMQSAKRGRGAILAVGILFDVLLLGYYKYADFFIVNINAVFSLDWATRHLILPLGISFFTFQQIAYLYEVYTGGLRKHYSFLSYSLFISYFPQLIAGPIVLPEEMMSQFDDPRNQKFDWRNFSSGLYLFSIGLAKKLIIADTLAVFVDRAYSDAMAQPLDLAGGWAALGFWIQLYFDFSAYSDMALGLGRMFNIRLPLNFNSPLRSASIQEFWRTWHITLGRFFSSFIYIPLGGNRKGKLRTLANLFITAFVCGFWHGAGWFYIIWGALNGLGMVVHRVWSMFIPVRLPRALGVALTFSFIALIGVFFRAQSWEQICNVFHGIFNFGAASIAASIRDFSRNAVGMFALALVIIFFVRNASGRIEQFRLSPFSALCTIVLLVSSVFCMTRISPFLYFNF